ncbi:DnaJ molecular chaperone [uncultured virus]|nr:DnaJ molecular chaperone [uncultured virus]
MNFYDILEINQNATSQEIKKSYKQLVKKYHPDKCIDKNFSQKFIEIKTAYDILSDETRRKDYDELSKFEQFEIYDLLKNYLSEFAPQYLEIYKSLINSSFIDENDIRKDINTFNFRNIYNKYISKLLFKLHINTPNDNKEGKTNILNSKDIDINIPIYHSNEKFTVKNLNIIGIIDTTLKDKYQNKFKKISVTKKNNKKLSFVIPLCENEILIKNEGEEKNDIKGDIIIKINCKDDYFFKRINDYDLYLNKYITLQEYTSGYDINFEHLDGEIISLKFDANLEINPILCIKKKGLPINSYDLIGKHIVDRGNLYIHLNILENQKKSNDEILSEKD